MRATNMANGVRSGESHSERGHGCVGRTQPRRRLSSAEAVAIDRTSPEVSRLQPPIKAMRAINWTTLPIRPVMNTVARTEH
jgi:hypothetical protein